MLIKTKRWALAFILAFVAVFMVACDPTEDPTDPTDPTTPTEECPVCEEPVELDDQGTPMEIVMRAKAYLEANLPAKTFSDVTLLDYALNPEVEVVYAPRTSTVEEGKWIYNFPENDYRELLDITLSYKGFVTEFVYTMEVYGASDFDKFATAQTFLQAEVAKLDPNVTADFVLPLFANGLAIDWISGSTSILSFTENLEDVTVNYARPRDNTPVKLTALLRSGAVTHSVSFNFVAVGYTQEEKVEYLTTVGALKAIVEAEEGSTNLQLPANESYFGATFAWESSNTDVMDNTGKFLNPAEDTAITLTVTVTYNSQLSSTYSFVEEVEIPFTVKALSTEAERAAYDLVNDPESTVPTQFYWGMEEGNQITGLPTTVDGYPGVTVTWAPADAAEFDANFTLLKGRLLYHVTNLVATVTDGDSAVATANFPVNVGIVAEQNAYGLTARTNQLAAWTPESYAAAVGFNNVFDATNGASWLGVAQADLDGDGFAFKAQIGDNLFYYFAARNQIHAITAEKLLAADEDGHKLIDSQHASLMAYTWASASKMLYNDTEESVYMTPEMWVHFTFSVNAAYMVFIIHEGEVIYATPTAGDDAPAAGTHIEIPAGAFVWAPAYLDNNNGKMFGTVGQEIEVIRFTPNATIA